MPRAIRVGETWDQLGLRGSGSHDLVFEDVAPPLDHAVDLQAQAEWARRDADGAAWNALLISALYTGVAEAARNWLVGLLRERTPANLGVSLATLPRMRAGRRSRRRAACSRPQSGRLALGQ